MNYSEDELLMLSGIQHFLFCKKQWALIHVDQLWEENVRTFKGRNMHNRADDPFATESRGSIIISRSIPVVSFNLGLYGITDVVEFVRSNEGIELPNAKGRFQPYPIEYKVGEPKDNEVDKVQLCAQAICLEEMMDITIEQAYIYYGKTRRRVEVLLDESIRLMTIDLAKQMHIAMNQDKRFKGEYSKKCRACSLYELCRPSNSKTKSSVDDYIKKALESTGEIK